MNRYIKVIFSCTNKEGKNKKMVRWESCTQISTHSTVCLQTNSQRMRSAWLSRCVKVSQVIYQYLRPHRGVCPPAAIGDKRGRPVDCSHTQTPQWEKVCVPGWDNVGEMKHCGMLKPESMHSESILYYRCWYRLFIFKSTILSVEDRLWIRTETLGLIQEPLDWKNVFFLVLTSVGIHQWNFL